MARQLRGITGLSEVEAPREAQTGQSAEDASGHAGRRTREDRPALRRGRAGPSHSPGSSRRGRGRARGDGFDPGDKGCGATIPEYGRGAVGGHERQVEQGHRATEKAGEGRSSGAPTPRSVFLEQRGAGFDDLDLATPRRDPHGGHVRPGQEGGARRAPIGRRPRRRGGRVLPAGRSKRRAANHRRVRGRRTRDPAPATAIGRGSSTTTATLSTGRRRRRGEDDGARRGRRGRFVDRRRRRCADRRSPSRRRRSPGRTGASRDIDPNAPSRTTTTATIARWTHKEAGGRLLGRGRVVELAAPQRREPDRRTSSFRLAARTPRRGGGSGTWTTRGFTRREPTWRSFARGGDAVPG